LFTNAPRTIAATVEGVGADEDGAVCAEDLRSDPELELLRRAVSAAAGGAGDNLWLDALIGRLDPANASREGTTAAAAMDTS
jgi:hypothetical protein